MMRRPLLPVMAMVALLLALAASPARASDGDAPTTLKQAYAGAFRIGTAVSARIIAGDDAVAQALVALHFNAITAENAMKAEVLHPRPGRWDFAAADAFVDFGRRHGMFVVGHTLVWHNQTPDWFFTRANGRPVGRRALAERMQSYIETVAGRYVGRVDAWDVVNEVIGEDGRYRDTRWVRGIGDGDELVRLAFGHAARAAPGAELYYNDFNAWRPAKRDGIVRMVRMLQAHGLRIDGIGMQGHWGLDYPAREDIEAAIDAYAALGVKVMITELDVDVLPLTRAGQVTGTGMAHPQFQLPEFRRFLDPYRDGLPDAVQRQLADRYAELFGIFHARRDRIDRVGLWGIDDGMSWKNDYPVPGRTNHPLLFDRAHRPKPALAAVLAVPATVIETIGGLTRYDAAFDRIVVPGRCIEVLAEGFRWAEGPAWIDGGGFLLFTDVPSNRMHRWSPREGASVFLEPSGYVGPEEGSLREPGANGLFAEPAGTVLLANSGARSVQRLDLGTKRRTTLADRFEGRRFNSPNDLVRRADGRVFFTDPPFGLEGIDASATKELPFNGVYRLDPDGSVHLLDAALRFPNGIALSPDGRTLYVSNTDRAQPVWIAYTLDDLGRVVTRRLFADASDLVGDGASGLPDGMAVSAEGHLFASGPGGVIVFDAGGRRLGRIETGGPVSNVTFGDDGQTLYLTSGAKLARVRVAIAGAGFRRARRSDP